MQLDDFDPSEAPAFTSSLGDYVVGEPMKPTGLSPRTLQFLAGQEPEGPSSLLEDVVGAPMSLLGGETWRGRGRQRIGWALDSLLQGLGFDEEQTAGRTVNLDAAPKTEAEVQAIKLRSEYGDKPVLRTDEQLEQRIGAQILQLQASRGDSLLDDANPVEVLGDRVLLANATELATKGLAGGADPKAIEWARGYLSDYAKAQQSAMLKAEGQLAETALGPEDYMKRVVELKGKGFTDTAIASLMQNAGWKSELITDAALTRLDDEVEILAMSGDFDRAAHLKHAKGTMLKAGLGSVDVNVRPGDILLDAMAKKQAEGMDSFDAFRLGTTNAFFSSVRGIHRLAGTLPPGSTDRDILERMSSAAIEAHPVAGRAGEFLGGFIDPVFLAVDLALGGLPVGKALRGVHEAKLVARGVAPAIAKREAAALTSEGLFRTGASNYFVKRFGLSRPTAEILGNLTWNGVSGAISGAGTAGLEVAPEDMSPLEKAVAVAQGAGYGATAGVLFSGLLTGAGKVAERTKVQIRKLRDKAHPDLPSFVSDAFENGMAYAEKGLMGQELERDLTKTLDVLGQSRKALGRNLNDQEIRAVLDDAGINIDAIAALKPEDPAAVRASIQQLEAQLTDKTIPPEVRAGLVKQWERAQRIHAEQGAPEIGHTGQNVADVERQIRQELRDAIPDEAVLERVRQLDDQARKTGGLKGADLEEYKTLLGDVFSRDLAVDFKIRSAQQLKSVTGWQARKWEGTKAALARSAQRKAAARGPRKGIRGADVAGEPLPKISREEALAKTQKAFGYKPDEMEAIGQILDARAKAAVKAGTFETVEDFYAATFADIRAGGKPGDAALFQDTGGPEALMERARTTYGTTRNPNEAGYVLPEGGLLDFSGRKHPKSVAEGQAVGGSRMADHGALEEIGLTGAADENRARMLNAGAVRVDFPAGVVQFAQPLSESQVRAIARAFKDQANPMGRYVEVVDAQGRQLWSRNIDDTDIRGLVTALAEGSQKAEAKTGGVLFQEQPGVKPDIDKLGFFHRTARAAMAKIKGTQPAKSALAALRNSGVSNDEMRWTGLEAMLEERAAAGQKVTAQEIQEYLARENGATLKETVYSEAGGYLSSTEVTTRLGEYDAATKRFEDHATQVAMDAMSAQEAYEATMLPPDERVPPTDRNEARRFARELSNRLVDNEDVIYGGELPFASSIEAARFETRIRITPASLREAAAHLPDGHDANLRKLEELGKEMNRTRRAYVEAQNRARREATANRTTYGSYTLEGGTQYREILLTVPRAPRVWTVHPNPMGGWDIKSNDGGYSGPFASREVAERYANPSTPERTDGFKSAHWEPTNIVAHIRTKDRTLPDGSKMLFLEEMQSDWHQQGRERGYRSSDTTQRVDEAQNAFQAGINKRHQIIREKLGEWDPVAEVNDPIVRRVNEIQNILTRGEFVLDLPPLITKLARDWDNRYGLGVDQLEAWIKSDLIPTMQDIGAARREVDRLRPLLSAPPEGPWSKNWHEMAYRRALRRAVEGGYDAIGWTTGRTQGDRYQLNNYFRDIDWRVQLREDGQRIYDFTANTASGDPGRRVQRTGLTRPEAIEHLGEGLVQRIDSLGEASLKATQAADGSLSDAELEIPDAGMSEFYDQILPRYAAKQGKPWGLKVERGGIPTGRASLDDPLHRRFSAMLDAYDNGSGEMTFKDVYLEARTLAGESKDAMFSVAVDKVLDDYDATVRADMGLGGRGDAIDAGDRMMEELRNILQLRIGQTDIHMVRLTPEAKAAVLNEGLPLFQRKGQGGERIAASVEFLEDGRAVIRALERPDITSFFHEIGHVFRRQLEGEDLRIVQEWAGVKDNQWDRKAEEKFARAWERYLRDGLAPVPALKRVFEQLKAWFTGIYHGIRSGPLNQKISPELRGVFDRMLGAEAPAAAGGVPKAPKPKAPKRPPGAPFVDLSAIPEPRLRAGPLVTADARELEKAGYSRFIAYPEGSTAAVEAQVASLNAQGIDAVIQGPAVDGKYAGVWVREAPATPEPSTASPPGDDSQVKNNPVPVSSPPTPGNPPAAPPAASPAPPAARRRRGPATPPPTPGEPAAPATPPAGPTGAASSTPPPPASGPTTPKTPQTATGSGGSTPPPPPPPPSSGSGTAAEPDADRSAKGPRRSTRPPPPAVKPIEGREADLVLPGRDTPLRVRYVIASAADAIPSHDARAGFDANAYGDRNERDYRDPTEGKALRDNVYRMRDKLNPAMLHGDTPTAVDGPPIVNEDLVALGGNARTMLQQLVYHEGGDRAEFLREAVRDAAAKFGIARSADLDAIADPIILRVVSNKDAGEPGELSRVLNQSLTAARTSDTDSVSRGRKITTEHALAVSRLLPVDGTLADVFNERRSSEDLVNALIRAGALTRDDLVAYTDQRGLLNQEGRRLVERTLLGAAVPDVRRLAEIQPQLRQTLIRAIPAITKLRAAKDAPFDFDETLGLALDVLKDYRDSGSRSIAHLIEQSSMFPQPWRENRRAVALASALLEETPTTIQKRFNRLAGIAEADSGPGLFGETPKATFDDVFPYDGPEPGDAGAGPSLFDLEERSMAKGTPGGAAGSAGPTPPKWPPMPPGASSSPYVAGTARVPGQPPQGLIFRDILNPVAMPELLRLAKAIGTIPTIKAKTGARGHLEWRPGGKAKLVIDAGTPADPEAMAKTLAHEIGHLIDFMDDREIRRGNVLARVLSLMPIIDHLGNLRAFMRDTFPLANATNKELRKELIDLTRWWKPYDPRTSSPQFVAYRESAPELYADALSVLLNSPGTLAERAPKFYSELLTNLNRKPSVLKAYLDLQDLLAGKSEDLLAARRADIREDFGAGAAMMARAAENRAGRQSVVEWVAQMLMDTAAPIITREKAAAVKGIGSAERRAASIAMEEFALRDNAARIALGKVQRHVYEPMLEAGISKEDAGEFLMMNRIANGDRQAFGNPRGHTPETAREQLADLRRTLGPDRFQVLTRSMQRYQDIVYAIAEEAVAEGVYSVQAFREKIEPNQGFYATFAVVDHLEDFIPYQIMQQIGTFKGIANPFDTTLMKTVSLIRAIELNRAKRLALVEGIGRWFPSEVILHKSAPGMDPPKPRDGFEHLPYLVNGRVQHLEVDRYVAKAFKRHDIGILQRLGGALSKGVYGVFHPLYVTFSPSFAVSNIFRDIKRTYTNLAAIDNAPSLGKVLKAYWGARDAAWKRATSHYDPTIEAMLDDRALNVPFTKYDPTDESVGYEALLRDSGLVDTKDYIGKIGDIFKPAEAVLRFAQRFSEFTEALPKVATWNLLTERGVTGTRRAYVVRNYVGTPNTSRRGLASTITNSVFMYSNVVLQGMRADADIALRPKTAGGWWMRSMLIDFLPKIAMRAATIGLFGEGVRRIFELIPDYDKATYVVIPMGTTTDENGREKAVYLRVPHGDTHRTIAAPIWLLSEGLPAKAAAELFGQLPTNVNPYLEAVGNWASYLQGDNPYDSFRNRPIMSRDAYKAGGSAALEEMIRWQLNELGIASTVLHYFIGSPGQPKTDQGRLERIIGSIPGLERVVKISDRGLSEEAWAEVDNQDRERARFKLSLPQNARTATSRRYRLQRLNAAGTATPTDRAELARLNRWYTHVYTTLTDQIEQLEQAGRSELADRVRARLELLTDAHTGG